MHEACVDALVEAPHLAGMTPILALLFSLVACSAGTGETFMGRPIAHTMSHQGAPWLTRDSRQREERPDLLYKALALEPGETGCDIGAGNGYHTLRMAREVGPTGKVYAVDIQPEMLSLLDERVDGAGLSNVQTIRNSQTTTKLPAGVCDLTLMVDVYHELSDPKAMLESLRASLAPDGELALVEYREEDPRVPIKPAHKMSKAQVHKELTAHGFKLVRESDELPWQHVMIYRRDDGPGKAKEPKPWSLGLR